MTSLPQDQEIQCFNRAVQYLSDSIAVFSDRTPTGASLKKQQQTQPRGIFNELYGLVDLLWELLSDPREPRRMIMLLEDGTFFDMVRKVLTTNPKCIKSPTTGGDDLPSPEKLDQLQRQLLGVVRKVLEEGQSTRDVVGALGPHLNRTRVSELLLRYANLQPSIGTLEALFFSVTQFHAVSDVLSAECFLALLQIVESAPDDEVRSYSLGTLRFLSATSGGAEITRNLAMMCRCGSRDTVGTSISGTDMTPGEQFYIFLLRVLDSSRPRFQQNIVGELLYKLMSYFLSDQGGSACPLVVVENATQLILSIVEIVSIAVESNVFLLLLEMCMLHPLVASSQKIAMITTFIGLESSYFNAGRVCRYFVQSLLSGNHHSQLFRFLHESENLLDPLLKRILTSPLSKQNSEFSLMIALLIAASDRDEPFRRTLEIFCEERCGGVALVQALHELLCKAGTEEEPMQVVVVDRKGNLLNSVEVLDREVPRAWADPRYLPLALDILRSPTTHGFSQHSSVAPRENFSWQEKHVKVTAAVLSHAILECSLN